MKPLSKSVKPFSTSTGVMIGINYTPPPTTSMSQEDELWQGVMLGIEPEWSQRRIVCFVAYVAIVASIFLITFWKAKEAAL
jgi:hypothetical protein